MNDLKCHVTPFSWITAAETPISRWGIGFRDVSACVLTVLARCMSLVESIAAMIDRCPA